MIGVPCPECGANMSACGPNPDGTVSCPRCGRTVAPGAENAETVALPAPAPGAGPTLSIGSGGRTVTTDGPPHIPGYEVLEEVGRGGMGVVYKARQFNPPRVVAVKMILAGEHADPEQLVRFQHEAEAIARLTHPTIAQIHQVGNWHPPAGGPAVPFLTLEFVAGQSLWRRLESGPAVGPRAAAALVQQLARGVQYAHDQGVVHRDLKPANVLLCGTESSDSLGEVKIVDFGLAKPLDGFATTVTDGPRTRTGAVLGTPSYMAPEQAAGKGTIGPATDVYALGAILYELLTGRPPFFGESTLETLLQVTKDDPEPPRRVRPSVPRDLETVCLTCLAKDPARRYPSAAALAKDLGRFLAGEPVKVRPPSRAARFVRWARRHKGPLYLASGAALALMVVLAVALSRPAPEDPGRAEKSGSVSRPPADDSPMDRSRQQMIGANNLRQLGLALHNVHDVNGTLPPAAICDKTGKSLLSWRVAILPYIEEDVLYKQFKFDEPWDSTHNKKLIEKMPKVFAVEGKSAGPAGTTHYQAVVGPQTAWELQPQLGGPFGRRGLSFNHFIDGASNTILLAEGADPVIWTKPTDLTFDGTRLPTFGGVSKGGFQVLMADGSVSFLHDTVKPEDLRAALTRNGGEVPAAGWDTTPSGPTSGPGRVRGKITLNGQPIKGARLILTAEETSLGLSVPLSADGTYSVNLPPGQYRVAFQLGTAPKDKPWEKILGEVPEQYTNAATSGLTLSVRSGDQTVNFPLGKGATQAAPKK